MTTRATYLTAHDLARVAGFWPAYLEAVGRVKLPAAWAFAMAAVHYEESGFAPASPAGEHGGPFCFDPAGGGYPGTLDEQIAAHVWRVRRKYSMPTPDPVIDTNFQTAALVAADELLTKLHPVTIMAGGWEDCRQAAAWAMWGYNSRSDFDTEWHRKDRKDGAGPAPASWRWSPYVSNDPLNGVQLYTASGTEVGADGTRTPIAGGKPKDGPGTLIVADELHARWREWYVEPASPAA